MVRKKERGLIRLYRSRGYSVAIEFGVDIGVRLEYQYFGYDGHQYRALNWTFWNKHKTPDFYKYGHRTLSECSFSSQGDCDCRLIAA